MTRSITRRDLLNGVAVSAGAGLLASSGVLAAGKTAISLAKSASNYYPPTLTGMRGSHTGSFEVAHDLSWRGQKRPLKCLAGTAAIFILLITADCHQSSS